MSLVQALHEVAAELDVIIPLHPRGRATLTAAGLLDAPRIRVVDPLGYIEFMSLVRGAAAIVTDSGGVQEETTLLRVPCLTLRPNTERPITITSGSNRLVTRDELAAAVLKAVPTARTRASCRRCGTARPGRGSPGVMTCRWLHAARRPGGPDDRRDADRALPKTRRRQGPAARVRTPAWPPNESGSPASSATPGCSWP